PLLLKGGRVIDPSRSFDQTADVLVQDGKIAAVGPTLGTPDGVEVRDVRGAIVAPGLVDLHVHLREPGNEDVETVASGARAAAAGCAPRSSMHAPSISPSPTTARSRRSRAAASCTKGWSPRGSVSRESPPPPKRSWWRATCSSRSSPAGTCICATCPRVARWS